MNPTLPYGKSTFWQLAWSKRSKLVHRITAKLRRLVLEDGIRWVYERAGVQFLNEAQTASFLQPYRLVTHPVNTLPLTRTVDLAEPGKIYFAALQAKTEPVYVWHYDTGTVRAKLLPYGSILTGQKVLCADSNTDDFFWNVLHRKNRPTRYAHMVIAPWSHYLDGAMWGGYYDFVLLLVGKLCRIKDALSESDFNEALVAYPLFNTTYEREYLALLGVETGRVVDSRTTNVTFDECILANVGHWFYPNSADINALRKYVLAQMPPPGGRRNRIYVSRSGRRCVQNESEVISLLGQYDFQIIEDKPRSVAEQIAIYQQADFIIGPHGASFTNILWCEPGTHLFELFSPTYFPDFFRYLAELLGLHYSAYFHGPAGTDDWTRGQADDMYVSVPELKQCLDNFFPTIAS